MYIYEYVYHKTTHLLEKVLGELLKGETCPKIPQTYENSSCGEFTGCG
jgi:hypothetical protein